MGSRRFQRDIEQFANALGYSGTRTGSNHFRWVHPEIPSPVFTAATPRVQGGDEERNKLTRALTRARALAGFPAKA